MKKTYVKPVMESEEFVANEYVAACWRVVCKCESHVDHEMNYVSDKEPVFELNGILGGEDTDGFVYILDSDTLLTRAYYGEINGSNGDPYLTSYCHPIESVTENANASV